MVSLRGRLFYVTMKLFFRGILPTGLSLKTYRKISNQPFFEPMPRGISRTIGSVAGVPGEWITPSNAAATGILLYLHGGGYVLKTPRVHRVLVGRLARAAGVTAFMPDYRLAPEHPFPAALDDAVAVYRELIRTRNPADIILTGDSGGGGLAAALLLKLRDSGDPLPAAACLISAMLDCTFVSAARADAQKRDPFLRLPDVAMMAKDYYGDHDPSDPLISPVFADFHGLPPLLVHASQDEILCPEAVRYAEYAKSAGVDVTLKIWEGMIHAFPLFAGFVPEGKTAITEIGAFFRQHLRGEVV
ncbi:MAG: alpha/beta hydrolase [Chloroflexota bacterium]